MKYDAIFFDFDGTLVDSEPIHFACWQDVLQPLGINLTWDNYFRNCIGVSDRAMIARLSTELGLGFDELYATYPHKKALFRDRILSALPMPQATRELLASLDVAPLGVVTSSEQTEVEPLLRSLGVLGRFKTLVYGDQVRNLKPHPEPYLEAARRLGVKHPLVFEDSGAGIASATAAGFEVIRVTNPDDLASQVQIALT